MNILQVVPSVEDEASGPSYCVPRLSESLAALGHHVELHTLGNTNGKDRRYVHHVHLKWRMLGRLGVSPRLRDAMRRAARHSQILHNHSLWMMPNIYPAAAVRGTNCRLVVTPHGTLTRWALRRSRFRKAIVWACGQRAVLEQADCFHATATSELEDIRRERFQTPVAVIPNGVDVPVRIPEERTQCGPRRLLFFGRLHPVKGIDVLLRAWKTLQGRFPQWELQIAGSDHDGFLAGYRRMARELALKRVTFAGPAYGEQKNRLYWSSDLYVLPTHSENFGMTVAEALAHGVPAVVTKGAPWQGLDNNGCGWWIDIGAEPLAKCLHEVMTLSREELQVCGARGRAWMQRDFSWDTVGHMMHDTYTWLVGGGNVPGWIHLPSSWTVKHPWERAELACHRRSRKDKETTWT